MIFLVNCTLSQKTNATWIGPNQYSPVSITTPGRSNINRTPPKNPFWKIEPRGFNRADTVVNQVWLIWQIRLDQSVLKSLQSTQPVNFDLAQECDSWQKCIETNQRNLLHKMTQSTELDCIIVLTKSLFSLCKIEVQSLSKWYKMV